MRHPVFIGLREERKPRSVRLESPLPPQEETPNESVEVRPQHKEPAKLSMIKNDAELESYGRILKLTNLNKVYWPSEKYTKRDLIEFYREMAPFVLPYLKDRPESLHRHPNGVEGESFYQKDLEHHPAWVKTVRIGSESQEKEIRFLICQDEPTLIYMANLGCIEINPWSSRLGMLDHPDFLVIDLDPEDIAFEKVVEAALAVREVLESAEADSFCKTSGKSGLHIYVPLGGSCNYDQARQFAEIIARLAHQKLPSITSLERNPKRRQKRVYLDYLQNRRGQTLAAPYSCRPHPGATVSTPLNWAEVNSQLDPSRFTIRTIRQRLDKHGDLFQPILSGSLDLMKSLERLQ